MMPHKMNKPTIVSIDYDPGSEIYSHQAFTELHEQQGSGIYAFGESVGMGGVFRLTSRGVIPLNPISNLNMSRRRFHDEYDILRAIELGQCWKLTG